MKLNLEAKACALPLLLLVAFLAANADAQDGEFIKKLLLSDLPTKAQYTEVVEEISGIWVAHQNGQITHVLEIQPDGSAFRNRGLADFDLQFFRDDMDVDSLIRTLSSEKEYGQSELKKASPNSPEQKIGKRALQLLDNIERIALDAKALGAVRLPEGKFSFRTRLPNQFGELRQDIVTIRYTKTRLYEYSALTLVMYDRVEALSGAVKNQWLERGKRDHKYSIDLAYSSLYSTCVTLQRRGQPLDECRAWRDRLIPFGATPKLEFVLERDREFPIMSDAEKMVWASLSADNPESDKLKFPLLSYCFSSKEPGADRGQFSSQIAARGFRDTMWDLHNFDELPLEKPGNWSEAEFSDLRNHRPMFGSQRLFLRADGLFSVHELFDNRNRWSVINNTLQLSWHDGVFTTTFPIVRNRPVKGTSTFAYMREPSIGLMEADFYFLSDQHWWVFEGDTGYQGFRDQWLARSCEGGNFVDDIAVKAPPVQPYFGDWRTRPVNAIPALWQLKFEMAKGGEHPDPAARETMKKIYFLKLDSTGTYDSKPGPDDNFLTDTVRTWQLSPTKLVLEAGRARFTFDLPVRFDGPISAVEEPGGTFRYILTPADITQGFGPNPPIDTESRQPAGVSQREATQPVISVKSVQSVEPAERNEDDNVVFAGAQRTEVVAGPAVLNTLVGCWKWSNGLEISVNSSGSANNGFASAPWISTGQDTFDIDWPDFGGTMTLSDDGQSLNGLDSFGVRSTAQRMRGSPESFAGDWLWDNGLTVSVSNDRKMTLGVLNGTWSGSGKIYNVVWPIVDDITVAANGDSLSGSNQFGAFTATRMVRCR